MREEGSVVELLVPRCAGLDVAKDEVVACVRVPDEHGGRTQEVRTYPTFTSGLEALAEWLAAEGVTQVVMEATGQYWKLTVTASGLWDDRTEQVPSWLGGTVVLSTPFSQVSGHQFVTSRVQHQQILGGSRLRRTGRRQRSD